MGCLLPNLLFFLSFILFGSSKKQRESTMGSGWEALRDVWRTDVFSLGTGVLLHLACKFGS